MKKLVLILIILAGAGYHYFADRSYNVLSEDGSGTHGFVRRGDTRPDAGGQDLHSGAWQEVGEQDFDRRVLQAKLPALVYFDTAIGCRDADWVFTTLSRQRQGVLAVFYVNAEAHPQLARTYGVDQHVVFVLFDQGRVVKRATAPEVLQSVMAKNRGLYTHEGFLREMEAFANLL